MKEQILLDVCILLKEKQRKPPLITVIDEGNSDEKFGHF
jgi:hypothetical protein